MPEETPTTPPEKETFNPDVGDEDENEESEEESEE